MHIRKKILLTEDDEFTRFMMREIFDALGYEADIVDNAEGCCSLIRENPNMYGLILMDIHMPQMSGIDATFKIRQIMQDPPRNIPIVAITADVDFHDEDVARENGMDGFIRKPVTPVELNQLIDKYCDAA